MKEYKDAGVGQRIKVSDDERTLIFEFFENTCAFCGRTNDDNRLQLTRLVPPRVPNSPGDELFNIIPACQSCQKSRTGRDDWSYWFKRSLVWNEFRQSRIEAWFKSLPRPLRRVVKNR